MRVRMEQSRLIVGIVGLSFLSLATACEDGLTDPGNADPSDEEARVGSVHISTSTSGSLVDPDGYAIMVDGQPGPTIGVNGTTSLTGIPVGDHSVELQGVAGNCAVAGTNPRDVSVEADTTATVSYTVTCTASASAVVVTMSTTSTGSDLDLDPDGYEIWLDGVKVRGWVTWGTVTLTGIEAGGHEIELRHLDSNCSVTGDNPVAFTVAEGIQTEVRFDVECAFVLREIVFVQDGAIVVMAADGSSPRTVAVEDNTRDFAWPSWSPDGSQIAFSRFWCWFDCAIKVLDLASGAVTNLAEATPGGLNDQPAWSPDGSRIAYTGSQIGQIHVMNSDGSHDVQLTDSAEGNGDPAWSPDGSKILFASSRDGNSEVYVMNADGSNPVRLTFDPDYDGQPDWSPDGSRIVFTSRREGNAEIYTMDPDGSNLARLTFSHGSNTPAWSADGSRIIFSKVGDIWIMNADGSGQQGLTNDPWSTDAWPDWLP